MRLLAFDTATPATVVAFEGRELRHDPAPGERPGHAAQLLPLAARLLEEAGLTFADLDRVAVGIGPGTFTGLRIGVATARALAQGAGAELVGISTLRTLAQNAPDRRVLAVLDARRGEAFAAAWVGDAALLAPAALDPASLAERARALSPSPLAVGDGAVRFRMDLEAAGAEVPADSDQRHRVSARHHCSLAVLAAAGSREGVLPDYLRLPDAEIARRAR